MCKSTEFPRNWKSAMVDLIMLFIWSIHVRCWSNMSPNSFKFAFSWIDCSEQQMRRLLFFRLCLEVSRNEENRIDWNFSQLNIRLFCCDQDNSFSTSFWMVTAHSWNFDILQFWYRMVSSVCWMVVEYVWSTSSATYKLNSTGPSKRPWGTPKSIGNKVDLLSYICTYL